MHDDAAGLYSEEDTEHVYDKVDEAHNRVWGMCLMIRDAAGVPRWSMDTEEEDLPAVHDPVTRWMELV